MSDLKTINFLTCGHVDDGKSTLIGRLLYDINVVPEDHIEAAKDKDGNVDYALFTDGLTDERKQGITIDVAHRYFRHDGVRYHIADTPGHLEYMRNMAVAAVESDIAMILVDGIHGVRLQTVEYSKIARFFGVKQFLVVINKMDAVDFSEEQYNKIKKDYLAAFNDANDECSVDFVPVSALLGDNVVHKSENTPWYDGQTVLDYLKNAKRITPDRKDVRFPVQHMEKDENGKRWYMGTLQGNGIKVGNKLITVDSEETVTVTGIYHSGESVDQAEPKQAIAISVAEDVDLSRGTVLSEADKPRILGEGFYADVLWIDKKYENKQSCQGILKTYHKEEQAQITIDGENGLLKSGLVYLSSPIAIDTFKDNPRTGLFILTDSYTQRAIAVGTVEKVIPPQYMGASSI